MVNNKDLILFRAELTWSPGYATWIGRRESPRYRVLQKVHRKVGFKDTSVLVQDN